jgi:hypothetical protein
VQVVVLVVATLRSTRDGGLTIRRGWKNGKTKGKRKRTLDARAGAANLEAVPLRAGDQLESFSPFYSFHQGKQIKLQQLTFRQG